MSVDECVTGASADTWFPVIRRGLRTHMRLFCFPYAGGSAAIFARWLDQLGETIEVRPVQLPGRSRRMSEPPLSRIQDTVTQLGPLLLPLLNRPFALFGHSMGALVAFETARYVRRHGFTPVHLYVSGRRAPHIPDPDIAAMADLDNDAFVERLRELNGTPSEVLENSELMGMLLPTLRADFNACSTYRCAHDAPLDCPITVLGGTQDIESSNGFLEGWRDYTLRGSNVLMFPGDHFFIHTQAPAVLAALAASLQSDLIRR